MAFTFVSAEVVTSQMKGTVTGWKLELLESTLENLSARLAAWYPGLRTAYSEAQEDSELRNLVDAMITDAARKIANNPDGMSSETMGPFAYSRFDSEDTSKYLFNLRDLKALEDLLAQGKRKQVGSIRLNTPMKPAAPMPRPGKYTNSYRWKRY